MKRIVLLLSLVTLISVNMSANSSLNAGKSGILKKQYYGTFTADDFEDFYAGKRAKDFEAKANVTLPQYLQMLDGLVKGRLKEPNIAAAMQNSTVKAFPAGSQVLTSDSEGNWFYRLAYADETGFYHEPTGTMWVSFSCANPTDVSLGTPVKPTPPPVTPPTPPTPGNNNQNVYNNNSAQWDYLSYRLGQADMAAIEDREWAKAKNCNSCGTSSSMSVMTVREVAAPAPVVYAAQQQSSSQYITTRYKPNVLDYFNTAANVSNAVNRWFPQNINVNVRGAVGVIGALGNGGQQNGQAYSAGVDLGSQGQLPDNGTFVNQANPGQLGNPIHSNGW